MACPFTGRLAVLTLGFVLALPALAQWAWRDENGRIVYSDRAPPPTVKTEQILRRPAPGAPAPVAAPKSAPPAISTPVASKTAAERDLESRRQQQDAAEAARKAADQQARGKQLAEECERARGYLRALEDGLRVARTDTQGNREYLDDEQRAAEVRRTRENIDKNCKQ